METLYVKISNWQPPEEGWYTTNFGTLYFDGKTFIMSGHKRKTPIQVDWWLCEYIPAKE